MPGSPAPLPMSSSVAAPASVGQERQAVEEVLLRHLGRVGDGGEVHLPVPGEQPVGVPLELSRAASSSAEPQRPGSRSEHLARTARPSTPAPRTGATRVAGRWRRRPRRVARPGTRPRPRRPAPGRAARPRRRTGSPSACSSPSSSKERRSTAAAKSFSSRVFSRATAVSAPTRRPAWLRVGDDEQLAEDPLALAAGRDALHVDAAPGGSARRSRALMGAIASTLPGPAHRLGQPLAPSPSRPGRPPSGKPPTSRFTHLRPSARGLTTRFTRYWTASTSAEESSTPFPSRGVSETPMASGVSRTSTSTAAPSRREQLLAEGPGPRHLLRAPRAAAVRSRLVVVHASLRGRQAAGAAGLAVLAHDPLLLRDGEQVVHEDVERQAGRHVEHDEGEEGRA